MLSSSSAEALAVVSLPATRVLAIRPPTDTPTPSDFSSAFGRLVGFYVKPRGFRVVFPQMTLNLNRKKYAAIAFEGEAEGDSEVQVLSLPASKFVTQKYVGDYPGIPPLFCELMLWAVGQGYVVDSPSGFRICHLNSPDDTPAERLIHELYVPIRKAA